MSRQVKFSLKTKGDDDRPVYLIGNFNGWTTYDEQFKLSKVDDGHYTLNVDDYKLPDILDYKYTRGDWSSVELTADQNISPNRKLAKKHIPNIILDHVPNWRRNWLPYKKPLAPHVVLIDDAFEIPQLGKTRKIWALLPHDYYTNTDKRYPVLYLNDAQNLFDENSPYGNWEIDKKLAVLTEYGRGDIIIIAVEHAGHERISEYNFGSDLLGPASGKKYIRFLTDTLKIYVDKHYRTKADREFTGLGGSSLGGLISIFGGLIYPEVYSKLMIFSPSLWAAKDLTFPHIHFFEKFHTKMYIYSGGKESRDHLNNMLEFERKIKIQSQQYAHLEIRTSINPNGMHMESYWSSEFPRAIDWLFFEAKDDTSTQAVANTSETI